MSVLFEPENAAALKTALGRANQNDYLSVTVRSPAGAQASEAANALREA